MGKLDHMVQIAVNVILNQSITINKQYHLREKQLCTYSLVHFFADTAPLRREIACFHVLWRTQTRNDDEAFFLLFILNAVSNTFSLTPGNSPTPNKLNGLE